MFRVFRQEGSSHERLDLVQADHPIEAEEAYFRLCRVRTEGAGRVCVRPAPGLEVAVPRGDYRTDAAWRGPREQDPARFAQIWATPPEGWTGPSPFQVRAAARVAGWSGAEAARRLGVDGRTWRYWVKCGQGPRIPWTAWFALLTLAGLSPEQ